MYSQDTIITGVVDNRNPAATMQILQNAATDMQMMQVAKITCSCETSLENNIQFDANITVFNY